MSSSPRRLLSAVTVCTLALAAGAFTAAPAGSGADAGVVVELCSDHPAPEETTVTSQADGISIDITVFRPCGATADDPVPVILHSHGWGGTKATSGFTRELDAGFGVVSITQRGHGDSGGQANVQDPAREAQDIKSVIDHTASLNWVLHDTGPDGQVLADDPVLFAIGGSYGGGYQTITALTEMRETGSTRFNALAPEITWYDLPQSLAPQDVVRSEWNTLLYASGTASNDLPQFIHEAFAYGSTTGQWPDGTVLEQDDPTGHVPNIDRIFHDHSPVAFVEEGHHLDLPVIWRQGINDTLFPLNEGLHNFERTLTDGARARSIFVGYNGGHTLPTAYPSVRNDAALGGSDVCSPDGDFGALRLAFFQHVAAGAADPSAAVMEASGLSRYNLMTDDGEGCVELDALPALQPAATGEDVDVVVEQIEDGWMTTTAAGAATHLELPVEAGATVAGIPVLRGEVATAGVDQRAFFALSRGTSVADAQVIQSNLMPLRSPSPSPDVTVPFEIELPGVSVDLDDGERLFLTVTPFSEQFYGHGSTRAPGWMGFTDLEVDVPVVG